MKKITVFLFLSLPFLCFGRAGIADAFYDFQEWVFPAYLSCLILGAITFIVLTILAYRFRVAVKCWFSNKSAYFREHPFLGVIIAGLLLSIPVGIILSVLWQLLWFMAIIPFMGVVCSFPFLLAIGKFRNKCFLNPGFLKWSSIISLSAVIASLLFIGLIETNLLPLEDSTVLMRIRGGLNIATHPFDSLKDIWSSSMVLSCEIVLSLLFVALGKIFRFTISKLRKSKGTTVEIQES